ncbi:MAG: hypothetical protein DRN49_03630 [Thaumarchaeota archaeon]|nr:MAG: hypothetical protein DRN49_03630 [Nitrososphaerota archaeon]
MQTEIEIAGRKYTIRRPSRAEMYSSGLQYLSNLLDELRRTLSQEANIEKKKELQEEIIKLQYEYERKLLLTCVDEIKEEDLEKLDYLEWYQLVDRVIDFVFLKPMEELRVRRRKNG